MSRQRSGPRQPGGGGQMPGPLHQRIHVRRHSVRPSEVKAKRTSKDDGRGRPPLRHLDNGERPLGAASKVQTVTVTQDESGMRVDRFFEARFPGLSFSHIQRIIRKGEVRVNGKRTQPKARLEAGYVV